MKILFYHFVRLALYTAMLGYVLQPHVSFASIVFHSQTLAPSSKIDEGHRAAVTMKAARIVRNAILEFYTEFRHVTRRARARFELMEWEGHRNDTQERLNLYRKAVGETVNALRPLLGDAVEDVSLWKQIKENYSYLIAQHYEADLAETFFNRVARSIIPEKVTEFEYFDESPRQYPAGAYGDQPIQKTYDVEKRSLQNVILAILNDYPFNSPYIAQTEIAGMIAKTIRRYMLEEWDSEPIQQIEMLKPIFFRNKAAYLIGRIRAGIYYIPFILPLLNTGGGIMVDTVVLDDMDALSIFSSTRANFHIDVDRYREVAEFLKPILPEKSEPFLYKALGYKTLAKRRLYEELIKTVKYQPVPMRRSTDRIDNQTNLLRETDSEIPESQQSKPLIFSPGTPGWVMTVFTVNTPGTELVLKVIKDDYLVSRRKEGRDKQDIEERYKMVNEADRVGRLLEPITFDNMTIPKSAFAPEVLKELLQDCSEYASVHGDQVLLKQVYAQRKVTPLDVYVKQNLDNPRVIRKVLKDLGNCIKELAAANIYLADDALLRNFGVTSYGRVVCYDYDNFKFVKDLNFRKIPPYDSDHYGRIEPGVSYYYRGRQDGFPEDFLALFEEIPKEHKDYFQRMHGDLWTLDLWTTLQAKLKSGEFLDHYPYNERNRFGVRYRQRIARLIAGTDNLASTETNRTTQAERVSGGAL